MRSLRERVADTGWRRRIAARRSVNHPYRIAVGVFGGLVVALGVVAIPLPGPGWLIVIAGLFVLATEFVWAERLLEFTKKHVKRWADWVTDQPVWVRLLLAAGHRGLRLRRPGGHAAHDGRARLGAGVGAALALSVWHNRSRFT